jgi:hypothetical protein
MPAAAAMHSAAAVHTAAEATAAPAVEAPWTRASEAAWTRCRARRPSRMAHSAWTSSKAPGSVGDVSVLDLEGDAFVC